MRELLRKTIRQAYRRLLPTGARNSLHICLMFDRLDHPPEVVTDFAARHVLVLAPHMDDETIGCGGTILRHVAAGAKVTVLYLTDGRRGNPRLYANGHSSAHIAAAEAELVATRRREAQAAAEILGISEIKYLDGPDGHLEIVPSLVAPLRSLLEAQQPEIVYVPSVLDMHQDHWVTCGILYAALAEQRPAARPLIRGYEVWMPTLVNRLADITAVQQTKLAALRKFTSQLADVDYVRAVEGLNAYRSIHRGGGLGYAEGFHELSAEGFCTLYERIRQRP